MRQRNLLDPYYLPNDNKRDIPNFDRTNQMAEYVSTAAPDVTINKTHPLHTRIAWLDAARGICIILVVVGHAIGGVLSADLAAREGILSDIYYFSYTFHMSAFFVLSGLLARPSVNKNPKRFLHNSIKYILYPSTIQILIMNIFSNDLNYPPRFGLNFVT
jgi:uncharacterized membrane protein YcfT